MALRRRNPNMALKHRTHARADTFVHATYNDQIGRDLYWGGRYECDRPNQKKGAKKAGKRSQHPPAEQSNGTGGFQPVARLTRPSFKEIAQPLLEELLFVGLQRGLELLPGGDQAELRLGDIPAGGGAPSLP